MNELIKQISPQQMIRRATRLPVTGQTTSYRTGDDGDVKAGKARRFQTVGNLVYDWSTMLCWVANPAAIIPGDTGGIAATAAGVWTAAGAVNGGYTYGQIVQGDGDPDAKFYVCILTHTEAHEPPNATYWVETPWTASAANLTTPASMDWNNAIDRCLMTYAGIGPWSASNPLGWRLPNVMELMSIRDESRIGFPKLVTHMQSYPVDGQASSYCWTSTSRNGQGSRSVSWSDSAVNIVTPSKVIGDQLYVYLVRSLII